MTTILTTCKKEDRHPLLTKVFRRELSGDLLKSDYDRAYLFDAQPLDVGSIHDLHEALTWLEDQPHSCLIRGEPIGATRAIRRALNDCSDRGPATIRPSSGGLQWQMLDFDHVPVGTMGLDDSEARLRYLVNLLPRAFHGASYHYQWSSSAGLDDWASLSCHLWFWLTEPWLCRTLYERFHDGDFTDCEVDPAPFTPNQVHYTACPMFRDMSDPVSSRSGFVLGDQDAVELPVWRKPLAPAIDFPSRAHAEHLGRSQFEALLADIGPHYHRPILRAVAHYFAVTQPVDVDEEWLEGRVREAIHNAVHGRNRKADYLDAHYLRRVIQGARKFGRVSS